MSQPKTNRARIEVQAWPGLAISIALQMVVSVDEVPGVGEDFAALGHNISSSLADSILVFLLASMPSALTDLSLQQQTTDLEPEEYLDWIESLDAMELASQAGACDREEACHRREAIRSPEAPEWESPTAWLHAMASEEQLARVRLLLEDPASLKRLTTDVLRSFWVNHFRAIYVRHRKDVSRAIEEVRRHEGLTELPALLKRLLGRPIEHAEEWVDYPGRVVLVPFPFMGPYLMSMTFDEPEQALILAFDAKRAMGLQVAGEIGPDLARLKALADETRLKILRFVSESERFGGISLLT
ncbi:hypothetical protein ACFLSZ_00685 [Candidatus Bipolaricaulota bacterium]